MEHDWGADAPFHQNADRTKPCNARAEPGMAERPGAITRNWRWDASPSGEAPAAPRRRRDGRDASLVARLGPRKTLRARRRVPPGPRRAFGLPRGGPGRRAWLRRASAPPHA